MEEDAAVFYSIKNPLEDQIKIKRSVFVCRISPIETAEEAKAFISGISKENRTATHNCWAYILGDKGEIFHSSDAGEPSGTAGKPILNALQQHRLTHVAAVVTRYFGGVKLGIRGLMDAYSLSVSTALENQKLVKRIQAVTFQIEVPYELNDQLVHQLKNFECRLTASDYKEKIHHRLDVDKAREEGLRRLLDEYRSKKQLKYTRE